MDLDQLCPLSPAATDWSLYLAVHTPQQTFITLFLAFFSNIVKELKLPIVIFVIIGDASGRNF